MLQVRCRGPISGQISLAPEFGPLPGDYPTDILRATRESSAPHPEVCDCGGSCFDYVAQAEGGPMLFAISHSSIVLFAALASAALLGERPSRLQWLGAALVVVGLLVTVLPSGVPPTPHALCGRPTALFNASSVFSAS